MVVDPRTPAAGVLDPRALAAGVGIAVLAAVTYAGVLTALVVGFPFSAASTGLPVVETWYEAVRLAGRVGVFVLPSALAGVGGSLAVRSGGRPSAVVAGFAVGAALYGVGLVAAWASVTGAPPSAVRTMALEGGALAGAFLGLAALGAPGADVVAAGERGPS